jgi:tetratricopeptide (TPR) repeat protein
VVQGRGRFENRGRDDHREEREPVRRLPIPEDVTGHEIDPSVRQELLSLPKTLADDVARNLVMVARLLDEEPEQAYAYSRVALRLASRVAAVREAAGFASYATERYAEALAEFRATRRMTGTVDLWPVMADCERGLGRPERALEMAGAPEVHKLDKAGQVEMRLVAAGARQDMGQADAAVVTLQSSELASSAVHPWTARLRYAYADALLTVGRESEAREWFAKALEADHNGTTDASDRLAQLDGVEFVDAFDEQAAAEAEQDEAVTAGPDAGTDDGMGADTGGADLDPEAESGASDTDRADQDRAEEVAADAADDTEAADPDDAADRDRAADEGNADDADEAAGGSTEGEADAGVADRDAGQTGDTEADVAPEQAAGTGTSSFLDSPFREPTHTERDGD